MEKKDNSGRSFWVGVLAGCIVSAFVAVIVLCISIYRQRMTEQEPTTIEVAVPTRKGAGRIRPAG